MNQFVFGVITKLGESECNCIDVQCGRLVEVQAFEVGDLIILPAGEGRYGREVCGKQRKPSKWFLDMEVYKDLGNAVSASRAVVDGEPYQKGSETLEQSA